MQTRIVGRDGELEFIESRIDAARESQGSVILVAGEAGIGKSRLVAEVLARERDRPLYCAVGQCYEYLQTPFGPFSDMFAHMESVDRAAFAGDPDVREVVEELTSTRSRSDVLDRFDKRQLFKALSRAFELLAARSPILVAIDDLQWADQSTLELLQFLAAAAPRNRIVLLLTYRSREAEQTESFRGALAQLSRGPNAHTRTLGPLADEDIRSMLHAGGASNAVTFKRLVATVSQHADGNPLFAEELLKSATTDDPATGVLPLPMSVREAVLGRVTRLSEDDRRCVTYASAIGRRFSPALLARVVELSRDDVLSALEAAAQEQLIESDADGSSFRFRHELTRRSIYEELPPVTARLLHERVALALESEPASPVADLAYHYWMSADAVKAADFNEYAGDRARALFAYPEALAHYDRTLSSLSDVQSARVAILRENRGRCLYSVGSSDAALADYEAARDFYESHNMDSDAARLCIRGAILRWGQGRDTDGIAECRRALELVDETNVAYFQAHAYLGYFMLDRDSVEAFEHFESAERYTGPRDMEDAYVFHQCRALALATRGDIDGTIADSHRAAELALEKGNHALAIRCLANLGHRLTDLGERDRALRAFEEAAQIVAREELWDIECAVMLRQYAWANLQFGELPEAHRLITRALTFPLDSSRLRIFASQAAMLVGLRTLDDALVAQVDDAALLTEALEPGNESMLIAALAFAERDLILGRTDEGRDILHRVVHAYAGVKQARDDDGAFVLVAQYGLDEDAAVAREFVQRFLDETGTPIARAHLLLYDSVLAGRRGDRDAAKTFASGAFDLYHALGWRWHEARALEFSGKLKEAMRAYDVAGDARSTARLRDALNPVNRQGRAASDLTKREGEIARLAAEGKTNREIGDALHVSPRTVETHLATIFGKLSVRTRAELIAKWRDLAPVGRQVSSRSRRT